MRLLVLLAATSLLACDPEPVEPASSPDVVVTPALTAPDFQYRYSYNFGDAERTEYWIGAVNARVDHLAGVPTLVDYFTFLSSHPVPDIGVQIGDPRHWEVGFHEDRYARSVIEEDAPTAGKAQLLQDSNRRLDALKIWVELGREDEVSECIDELKQDQEWEAVAQAAILSDRDELLFEMTDKLVGMDWITRVKKNVVLYALSQSDLATARAICDRHDWNLLDLVEDDRVVGDLSNSSGFVLHLLDFALSGDEELLQVAIDNEFDCWGAEGYVCRNDFDRGQMVSYLSVLAEVNRDAALQHARLYLSGGDPEVFLWVDSGEGDYLVPARGSMELYALIQDEDELRTVYESQIRAWLQGRYVLHMDDPETHPVMGARAVVLDSYCMDMNGYCGSGDTDLVYAHMYAARNIPKLRAAWVASLSTLEHTCDSVSADMDDMSTHRAPYFFIEYGRAVLGESFRHDREELTLSERYILARLKGVSVPAIFHEDGSMMEGVDYDFIQLYLVRGHFNAPVDSGVFTHDWARVWASWGGYDGDLDRLLDDPAHALRQNQRAADERAGLGHSTRGDHPVMVEEDAVLLYGSVLPNLREVLPHQYEHFIAEYPQWALVEEEVDDDTTITGQ